MDITKLIIEDFDFARYEITRTYPLGDKTVIQIGESLESSPKSELEDRIYDLERENKDNEKVLDEKDGEISSLEEQLAKKEDELDACFLAITDYFITFPIDYSLSLAKNISNLDCHIKKEWLNPDEKFKELLATKEN